MPLLAALRFLTVIPLPGRHPTGDELAASLLWFPLVGLLLGGLTWALDSVLLQVWPASVTSVLDLALLALLTGGLHLDGLADSADGLFHPGGTLRRLEIMRDSRVGSHGVAAVVLVVLTQYAALTAIGPGGRAAALLLGPALARWTQVLLIWWFPYGRPEGRGTPFTGPGKVRRAVGASVIVVALTAALHPFAVVLAVAVAVVARAWGALVLRQLPGLTGDTYGAGSELTLLTVLLLCAAYWPAAVR